MTGHGRVERLWSGARWAEGPAWFAAGRYLVWSDIPNNRMLRYDETDGSVSVFPQPVTTIPTAIRWTGRAGWSPASIWRGASPARSMTARSRSSPTLEGKRLNSPNDVVVKSDGSIWFTDPPYGILTDYEGDKAGSEIGSCHVYRVDPTSGDVSRGLRRLRQAERPGLFAR